MGGVSRMERNGGGKHRGRFSSEVIKRRIACGVVSPDENRKAGRQAWARHGRASSAPRLIPDSGKRKLGQGSSNPAERCNRHRSSIYRKLTGGHHELESIFPPETDSAALPTTCKVSESRAPRRQNLLPLVSHHFCLRHHPFSGPLLRPLQLLRCFFKFFPLLP